MIATRAIKLAKTTQDQFGEASRRRERNLLGHSGRTPAAHHSPWPLLSVFSCSTYRGMGVSVYSKLTTLRGR